MISNRNYGRPWSILIWYEPYGDGLQKSAGSKLKRIIENLTSNVIMGVLVGMVVTMVHKVVVATTVMVVGFVNAGIMSLPQATGG